VDYGCLVLVNSASLEDIQYLDGDAQIELLSNQVSPTVHTPKVPGKQLLDYVFNVKTGDTQRASDGSGHSQTRLNIVVSGKQAWEEELGAS
jgi:hypothetical protein